MSHAITGPERVAGANSAVAASTANHSQIPGDRLVVERLPGASGPLLHCIGQLTGETASVLEREWERLAPMGHPVLTVSLQECDYLEVDGLISLLTLFRELHPSGRRLVLVAGYEGKVRRLLELLGIGDFIPLFPSEAVAALALRGGGPLPPPLPNWQAARDETLKRWRTIRETLDRDPEEALRLMTSMFAICDLAEALLQRKSPAAHARCEFCPLFYALGGGESEVGCRSALDPIVTAVRAGAIDVAAAKIAELERTIAEMPVPEAAEAAFLHAEPE
jgi:anti-anti-sigma regulatory factor